MLEKEAFITAGLTAFTLAALLILLFMMRWPARWSEWVERENNFWRDKGFISGAFAKRLKRWETGRVLKSLCLVTACIGILGVVITLNVWVKAIELKRHKLRVPYNPALVRPNPAKLAPAKPKPQTNQSRR